MKSLMLVAIAAAAIPAAASAQDSAPDGSRPFGLEPYVGVLGGYHSFDRQSELGTSGSRGRMDGALIEGVAGVNLPLGPMFVGAEGNVAKGFKDIDWEYGVSGRVGARAGDSGLIYVSAGYQWEKGKGSRGYPDRSSWIYGVGLEVGPKDIGLGGLFGGAAGPRLRLEAKTYDFDSIRPMAGVVFHF
ncbi:opacity protein [Sphingomonas quercus]|uniref:Opacity protein n=1 Tax=Sphingomonas quercus TaxID=2842451 RepID=A0ABS6BLH1_9SPHN|nr:opacity protein [Sphingomonas quercus]MBU3078099.1 opacity protein [Sphingomonas quercus]